MASDMIKGLFLKDNLRLLETIKESLDGAPMIDRKSVIVFCFGVPEYPLNELATSSGYKQPGRTGKSKRYL